MNAITRFFSFRRNPLNSGKPVQRSLFGEILDWMMAPLLLLWPLSMGLTYLVAVQIANAPFDKALDDSVTLLAQQLKYRDGQVRLELPVSPRELLRIDDTGSTVFEVLTQYGSVIATDGTGIGLPANEEMVAGVVRFRSETVAGQAMRIAYLWLDIGNLRGREYVVVQVGETLQKRRTLGNEIVKGVIIPQFLIFPIAVLLVWFGLSRGIAPLNSLQQTIRNRKPDDLSALETRDTPEELLPLISALNDQLQRLEGNITTQKRFIADAAHQLKTPLAGMRMQAELLMREARSPQEQIALLENLKLGTERATRLVNQMLAMARTEAPTLNSHEVLNLAEIARQVVEDFFDAAQQRGLDFGFEAPDHAVFIRGHAMALTEMIKNLVDNAIRYSPEYGTITVRVVDSGAQGGILLEVEDCGIGIPENERERVFDRFYRVLGTQVDGSGLGLSIVRETVSQHGAGISIHDNPKSTKPGFPGCLFRIAFPPAHIQLEN